MLSWGMKASLLGGERHDAVIHHLEVKALQIRNVAAKVEGEDLTLALFL
jgi:hypothetical protein